MEREDGPEVEEVKEVDGPGVDRSGGGVERRLGGVGMDMTHTANIQL